MTGQSSDNTSGKTAKLLIRTLYIGRTLFMQTVSDLARAIDAPLTSLQTDKHVGMFLCRVWCEKTLRRGQRAQTSQTGIAASLPKVSLRICKSIDFY